MSDFKRKFARGAAATATARMGEAGAVFCRNLILANLLGPENQGVAAVFAVVMSFLEMISDFGAVRLIVQDDEGDSHGFQASLQTAEIVRGILMSIILLACAGPVSRFFGVADAESAFRMLAVIPLIRGFQHLDFRRFQRHMSFGRLVVTTVVPQVLTAALAYPVAVWIGNYMAVLYLIILQNVALTVSSHRVAERPYRLGMCRAHFERIAAFGMPLVLNSILLFATLQGDRAVVGRFYSTEDLGIFATAAALAMVASTAVMSVVTPLALPTLSPLKARQEAFIGRYVWLSEIALGCSVAIMTGFIVLGPVAVTWLYTSAYAPAVGLIGILGLAAGLRTQRSVPNCAQMARGDNMGIVYCNVARLLGFLAMIICAMAGLSVAAICWCAVGGECAALATTGVLLLVRQSIPIRSMMRQAGVIAACVIAAFGVSWLLPERATDIAQGLASALLLAVIVGAAALSQRNLRELAMSLLRRTSSVTG